MATSESFSEAINKGIAEMRSVLADAAGRFETEARKIADAVHTDDRVKAERMKTAGDQLHSVVEMLRTEASKAANQFSDGINEAVGDVRDFMQDATPGRKDAAADQNGGATRQSTADQGTADKAADQGTAKKAAKKSPAKKSTAKKSTAKKAAKKSTAKKSPAKKAAKKSTAKKSPAKKAAKKSTAKKSPAKKSTAKKSPAKKAAKKSTAKKSPAKKAAKKSTTKKASDS